MRFTTLTLTFAMVCASLHAASDKDKKRNEERFVDASDLFQEVMQTPDRAIPQDLLEKAHCIAIVPGLKKAALGIGGKWGRGFVLSARATRDRVGVLRQRSVWKAEAWVSRSASLRATSFC